MATFAPLDILFYTAIPGDIFDEAIELATHSRYVHVAIVENSQFKIEALSKGITRNSLENDNSARYWSYTDHISPFDAMQVTLALAWLKGMVGTPYGWDDIASAAFSALGVNININDNRWACSFLAAETLQRAGGVKSLNGINAHTVTPGLLAHYLGVPA